MQRTSRNSLPALLAISGLMLFAPAAARADCPGDFSAAEAPKAPEPYGFKLARNPDGETTVDLAEFVKRLRGGIAEHNGKNKNDLLAPPARVRLFVDNIPAGEFPADQALIHLTLKPDEQYSVRLEAVDANGRLLENTYNHLLEKTKIRSVNPDSYAGEKDFQLRSPLDAKLGIDPEMPEVVQKIGRRKIVYVWKNPQDPRLANLASPTDFRVLRNERNEITGFTATDKAGKKIPFTTADVTAKVDAAFNENAFLWDDMFTCLHVMPFDPELCKSTVQFWLDVQQHHSRGLGDIPREVLKVNGTSYNPFEIVHLGHVMPNGSYTNPNIMGDVVEQLIDQVGFTPDNRKLAEQVLDSMDQYGKWMDNHRALKGPKGEPLGYWISDLGSGMDNIGRAPGMDFQKVGYVDELARRIELEKSSARLSARLGSFDRAKAHEAKAAELDHLLNSRYWSPEKGFYYDLIPGPGGQHVRQEDMPTVGGFWPLFSRSASSAQMKEITERWYTPETFGGDFPVRSLPPIMDKLRPGSYYPKGGYWRGGNWAPTDVIKALGEERSGRADLAADTINKKLIADTKVSNDIVKAGGHKTVVETIGTDETGHPIKGVQIENGHQHETREDFVGWGGTPHTFGKLRNSMGIRPVGGFGGAPDQLKEWIQYTSHGPSSSHSNYFALSPFHGDAAQQKLFGEGVLEINPPFALGNRGLSVANYNYHGTPVNLLVEDAGKRDGKRLVRVTITAASPVDMNVAFGQMGKKAGNFGPQAMSPITKIQTSKAGTTSVEMELTDLP